MSRRIFCRLLLVVVSVISVLVLSGVLSGQGRSEDAFQRVMEVQERHTERLMAIDGVEGTAVGLDDEDQPAVKVFLERGGVAGVPKNLDGVPVHAVVTGKIYALPKPGAEGQDGNRAKSVNPAGWFPAPVPIGVSTGHPKITAGTIGCRVKGGGNVYALSNNHVYANENNAKIGDIVLQPGTYDGGMLSNPNHHIGTLAAFVPIVFSRNANNTVDAAIALNDPTKQRQLGNATPDGGYGTPSSTIAAAQIGIAVQKYGRTTGLTKGTVTGIKATVNVSYGPGKTARFVNQIIITPGSFSAGGDSGSLVVTNPGRNPIGLLFAGSSTMTVANPIGDVLSSLHVAIDGQ